MHSIWYLILPDRVLINFDVPQYIDVISPLSRLVKPTLMDRLQAYPRYQLWKKADTPRRVNPDTNSGKCCSPIYVKTWTFSVFSPPHFGRTSRWRPWSPPRSSQINLWPKIQYLVESKRKPQLAALNQSDCREIKNGAFWLVESVVEPERV